MIGSSSGVEVTIWDAVVPCFVSAGSDPFCHLAPTDNGSNGMYFGGGIMYHLFVGGSNLFFI